MAARKGQDGRRPTPYERSSSDGKKFVLDEPKFKLPEPSTSRAEETKEDRRVITNYKLCDQPYTQLTIGLCGLEPEIHLYRNGQSSFFLSVKEFQELDNLQVCKTLSIEPADGGDLVCLYRISEDGGIVFQRRLNPYTCPMDFNDCVMEKFELSRFEVQQLNNHLPNAKSALAKLISNKPVFEIAFNVIIKVIQETYDRMHSDKSLSEVFFEVLRRVRLYTPRAYMVRLYFDQCEDAKCSYQLYNIIEICLAQHEYLKNRLDISSYIMSFQFD